MEKRWITILGVLLLAIGIAGSLSGGHNHGFMGFGINFNHNAIHISSGLLALLFGMASRPTAIAGARLFGVLYGLVWVAGLFNVFDAVPRLNLNMPDQLLHLALAAVSLWYGFRPERIALPPEGRLTATRKEKEREEATVGGRRERM